MVRVFRGSVLIALLVAAESRKPASQEAETSGTEQA
jgi:hypothetical protein